MQILAPAAVLVTWSLVVLLWMAGTRLPALKKHGVDLANRKPGGRGQDLEGVLPDRINWKAHNYAHLMEQPTIFYALVFILALAGHTDLDVWLAWGYAAIRIVHSLWQVLVNTVPVRLALFAVSSLILLVLAIRALIVTL